MKTLHLPSVGKIHGFLILLCALTVLSCGGNKSELANHIPKDATMVMTIDVKSMALKSMDFKQILTLDNLKKLVGSIGEKKDSAAASIANSGLDFASTIYVFGQMHDVNKYSAVVANISDAKKFEDFIKASYTSMEITEEDKMKFAKFENGQGIVAWSSDKVFVLFGDQMTNERVLALVNLKKEESLPATSDSFKESQKEGGDISAWISFAPFAKMIPQYGAGATQGMNFADTYMSAACNFEDGQIVIDTKYTTNPEMAAKYNFIKPSVSTEVVKLLPGESVIGLVGLALDMDKIYAQLEQQNLVQAYDPLATQFTGLTVKQILTMLSGDIALAVNGIEMKDVMVRNPMTGEMVSTKRMVPDYSAVIGIADKERLVKLLDEFIKAGMLTKKDKYYTYQDKLFIFEKGPGIVITGSEARMKAYNDAKSEKLNDEMVTMLNTHSSSAYFNPTYIKDDAYGDTGAVIRGNVQNSEVQSVTMTTTSAKDNVSLAKIVIAFKNKNENALVTIGRVSKKFKNLTFPVTPPVATDTTAAPNF